MEEALRNASAISDQRQKIEQYKLILSSVISSNDLLQSKHFIDHSKPNDSLRIPSQIDSVSLTILKKKIVQFYRMMCRWWFRGSFCSLSPKSSGDWKQRRRRRLRSLRSPRFSQELFHSRNRF